MEKFNCSFAYDVPHYVDFVVEAEDAAHAQAIMEEALAQKRFKNVEGIPDYDTIYNSRVFVQADQIVWEGDATMEEIITNADVAAEPYRSPAALD